MGCSTRRRDRGQQRAVGAGLGPIDRPGRREAPAYSRRELVDAILFLARTGCQWRYLQWRRWRCVARCYERTEASARAWLDLAAFAYLLGRV